MFLCKLFPVSLFAVYKSLHCVENHYVYKNPNVSIDWVLQTRNMASTCWEMKPTTNSLVSLGNSTPRRTPLPPKRNSYSQALYAQKIMSTCGISFPNFGYRYRYLRMLDPLSSEPRAELPLNSSLLTAEPSMDPDRNLFRINRFNRIE